MKFAHMADCHLGSWREPRLREAGNQAFVRAIDICISEMVDFALICGDLFNTAYPSLDSLSLAVKKFRELQRANIPVYLIAGSHDYSPSGRTMLKVLEEAGLATDVCKGRVDEKGMLHLRFTVDKKTQAHLTGILGRANTLERKYYEQLNTSSVSITGIFKIFLFHTAITEFKPKSLSTADTSPLSLLPKGFDYYAGGHVHAVMDKQAENHKRIVYPGPLFPNSFSELEELGHGGFFIYDDGKLFRKDIRLHPVKAIAVDCSHLTPERARSEFDRAITGIDFKNAIVLLRLFGTLGEGRLVDLRIHEMIGQLYKKEAAAVLRNTAKLSSEEFAASAIKTGSADMLEDAIISEHAAKMPLRSMDKDAVSKLIKELMEHFSKEKKENETVHDFEERLKADMPEM